MTLVELIRKRDSRHRAPATATPAIPATRKPEVQPLVASVATVAVARPHRENYERTPTHPNVAIEPASPTPPLQPGWLVAYRNRQQLLCGGCDDRQHGTIQECRWDGAAWTVHLTDGQRLSLAGIRSVGKTDGEGELVAAWTVREHGYDGMKGERSPVGDEAIPIELMCEEALPDTRAAQGQ